MTSKARFIAAAAIATLLALASSARAEGIVVTDDTTRLVVTAFGDGSWNWTGRGVIAGFQSPVRVDITDGREEGDRFVLRGVVTDSPNGLLDGWYFTIVVNPATGDYGVIFSFGNASLSFGGTGMVRILP